MAGKVFGIDCCGTVTKAGKDASLEVGDVVFGVAKMPQSGSIAEYTIAGASTVAKLPKDWTVEEGTSIGTAYNTALTGFQEAGMIQKYEENPEKPPVESILVIGASGGCGIAALQLAKGMGIPKIIGICSSKNAQFCKDNGATDIIAYDDNDAVEKFLKEEAGNIDIIYDSATSSGGGETYSQNEKFLNLLKQPKTSDAATTPSYLTLNGPASHWLRKFTLGKPTSDPRLCLVLTQHSTEFLELVVELLGKAKLKPVLDCVCEFTENGVSEGYKKLKSRRAKGKIVVKISDPDA
jgi:NADPH:quinone reductase-like Zn-dependent oxidoreductase